MLEGVVGLWGLVAGGWGEVVKTEELGRVGATSGEPTLVSLGVKEQESKEA